MPQVDSDDAATQLLHSLIPHTFFLRIQRGPSISSGVKAVQIVPQQLFAPDEHYVWLVDPNPIRQLALAVAMVAVVLAGVMFPLWPVKMRIGVWYLSVGVLGLIAAFFGLAIVRLVLWLVTKVVARPGIWLFPNLFADVGFVRSLPLSLLVFQPATDARPSLVRRSTRSSRPGAGTSRRPKRPRRRPRTARARPRRRARSARTRPRRRRSTAGTRTRTATAPTRTRTAATTVRASSSSPTMTTTSSCVRGA